MLRAALMASCLFALAPSGVAFAQAEGDQAVAEGEGDSATEHAVEHGHGGPVHFSDIVNNTEFWGACINFVLLLVVLRKLGKKPLSEFLVQRRREMEQNMAEAAAMKAKAEARYTEYTQRLAQLDQELAKLESDIARGAEEDKRRIIADAEEAATRLKSETESLIDQYAKALGAEIRQELVASAVAAAEKVLREAVNADDQQKLAERYRLEVASTTRNTGAARAGTSGATGGERS